MKGNHTHSLMPKKLAEALMEAGVQHFDGGGLVGALSGLLGTNNNFQAQGPQLQSQDNLNRTQSLQGRQDDVFQQQQNLANTLLAQSQGQGPNPALAMLNNQTGQNVQQQGALMASQRGASANPALIARQAAMQGAMAQQQGVGQAAALQAQQQLAAQGALQNQQNAMAGGALQGEGIQQGAIAAQNSANLAAQGINAQIASQNQATNAGILGGLLGGAGAALGGIKWNSGGEVPHYALGGMAMDPIMGIQNYTQTAMPALSMGSSPLAGALTQAGKNFAEARKKGQAEAPAGPSVYDFSSTQNAPLERGLYGAGPLMMESGGGHVPGTPEYSGDNEKNDVVPALLSPGEIVLPNSVTQAPDMEAKALEFLKHVKSSRKTKYEDVAKAKMNCGGKVMKR